MGGPILKEGHSLTLWGYPKVGQCSLKQLIVKEITKIKNFIANLIEECIEQIGTANVVEVITDNAHI